MRFHAAHQRVGKNVADAGAGAISDFVVETTGTHAFAFHSVCAVGYISDKSQPGQFYANGFFVVTVFRLFDQR